MAAGQQFSRVDTLAIRCLIEKKIGRPKAEKYFSLLSRFLSLKISRSQFLKLCISTLGEGNIHLHNHLLTSILKNVSLSNVAPPQLVHNEGSVNSKVGSGCQRTSSQLLYRDVFPSPRKGRSHLHDNQFRDRPSPLGPNGKNHSVVTFEETAPKIQEQQSATELFSLGSRPPASVEDGEEVDQAAGSPSFHSRSPVKAPLGIPINAKGTWKVFSKRPASDIYLDTCHSSGELPDSSHLRKRLKHKLEMEGQKISEDCANLLNNAIDAYLKRLIKPCLEFASSRSRQKHGVQVHNNTLPYPNSMRPVVSGLNLRQPFSASVLDFRVAMEFYPLILGEDSPSLLEKITSRASEAVNSNR